MIDPVPIVLKDLPVTIHGFTVLGSDYEPIIILNSRMSREQQRKTYRHEINHIISGQIFDEGYIEYER